MDARGARTRLQRMRRDALSRSGTTQSNAGDRLDGPARTSPRKMGGTRAIALADPAADLGHGLFDWGSHGAEVRPENTRIVLGNEANNGELDIRQVCPYGWTIIGFSETESIFATVPVL